MVGAMVGTWVGTMIGTIVATKQRYTFYYHWVFKKIINCKYENEFRFWVGNNYACHFLGFNIYFL